MMGLEKLNAIALALAVLVLGGAGPWVARELARLPEHRALVARAGERVVVLDVGGMTCAGCARSVRSALSQVPGVSAVEVSATRGSATVVCAPGVPDSTLTAAVREAGPGFLAAPARR